MQAIAAGDRDALGQLYDRHAGVVMGLCVRILGSRSEAEETVADIFVELWQRSGRYDPHRAPPFAYLVNLARSRAIDRLRRRRRQADLLAEVAAAPVEGEGAPSSYGRALHGQQRVLVRKAMDVLEAEERKVVELAFFRGLTHREIAEELAQPIGTVKTRIRRGLMRLRDELRNLEDAL
jgi:RNA polymerase sigma-70 factor (ECF subfamily)